MLTTAINYKACHTHSIKPRSANTFMYIQPKAISITVLLQLLKLVNETTATATMATVTMATATTSRPDLVEGVFPDLVQIGWLVVINVHLHSLLQLLPLCQVVVALQRRLVPHQASVIRMYTYVYVYVYVYAAVSRCSKK